MFSEEEKENNYLNIFLIQNAYRCKDCYVLYFEYYVTKILSYELKDFVL